METFTQVRPEHLNHYGFLFGGSMLKWVDEFAWIAATREFNDCRLVTIAMDDIHFREQVQNGDILRFTIQNTGKGKTSISYSVDVYASEPGKSEEQLVFSTNIVFCNVDQNGRKAELP